MKTRSIFNISAHFILLFLLITLAFPACKKTDILTNTIQSINHHQPKDFFEAPAGTSALTNRVIANIKSRNEQKEFVQEFAHKYGYPVWNKVVQKEIVRKNKFAGIVQQNSTDTIVLIPLVLENETKVNGYISATIHDSIQLNFTLAEYYKVYPYTAVGTTIPDDMITAPRLALQMMRLNMLVFGNEKYTITDSLLYTALGGSAATAKKEIVLRQTAVLNTVHGLRDGVGFDCYLVKGPYCTCDDPGSCDWNDPKYGTDGCPTCSALRCSPGTPYIPPPLPDASPTPPTPPGTGGGGGGIPPSYPCNPNLPVPASLNNNITTPPIGGDPLPPCPPPDGGTGWEPTPVADPLTNEQVTGLLLTYSNAANAQTDQLFTNSLTNNWEYSMILVAKDGQVYAKNVMTSHNPDFTKFNYTLAAGEVFVAELHTHPDPVPLGRPAFSGDDLSGLRKYRNKVGFIAFAECGDKRYALVIEDATKAAAYFQSHLNADNMIDEIRTLCYEAPGAYTNWQLATQNVIKNYIGSASDSGIGFYVSNNTTKTTYTKLNP